MTSTMSVAELLIMAIVIVLGMSTWLTLVFLADRQPSARRQGREEPGPATAGGLESAGPREEPAIGSPRQPAGAQEGPPRAA